MTDHVTSLEIALSSPCSSIDSESDSESDEEDEKTEELMMALAIRSYHLPGYSYMGDMCQYIGNNHPLLGIFFHHKLHPIKTSWRLLLFLGSVLFGLTVSNIFFLLLLSANDDERYQEEIFVFTLAGEEWGITTAYLTLWTVGGSAHAAFDISIWYITACPCCCSTFFSSERCQTVGHVILVFSIALLLAIASLLVLVRASIEKDETLDIYDLDSAGLVDDQLDFHNIEKEDVSFLLGYLGEFALALLVYYPLGSILLFSGIMGCFRLPVLGGRPRDMYVLRLKQEEEEEATTSGKDDDSTTDV